MVSSIIRRPLAVAAHMAKTFTKVRRRSTSWIGFEQPDPRLYLEPPIPALKRFVTTPKECTTPQETCHTARPTGTPADWSGSRPTQSTKSASSQFQAGATRVSLQIRNQAILSTRKYTNFKSGPWRDQYLPTTCICIHGVPATWGPDDATFNVLNELNISPPPHVTMFCFDNAVEEQAKSETKVVEKKLLTLEPILAHEMPQ